MSLSEDDIRRAIVNYMEVHRKKNKEMAELCGMSSPSMFSQYHNGITKTLKAEYLLHFLINTKTDINKFLPENFKEVETLTRRQERASEPNVDVYSCPECRPRVKKIRELTEEVRSLKDELLEFYRGRNKKDEGKCG